MSPSLAELVLLAASRLAPPALQDQLPFVSEPLSAPPHLLADPSMCLRTLREPVAMSGLAQERLMVRLVRVMLLWGEKMAQFHVLKLS